MTIEEAFEKQKDFCGHCMFGRECDDCIVKPQLEALEKQIPMKTTTDVPTMEGVGGASWSMYQFVAETCGRCGHGMLVGHKYCPNCGQRILQEEQDENED